VLVCVAGKLRFQTGSFLKEIRCDPLDMQIGLVFRLDEVHSDRGCIWTVFLCIRVLNELPCHDVDFQIIGMKSAVLIGFGIILLDIVGWWLRSIVWI